MKGIRFRDVSAREFLKFTAFALFIIFAVFFIAYYVVRPMPPDTIVMTTGREGLSYSNFGERYREILARSKVHLKLLDSSGSVENYNRLKDKNMAVDVGFVQGGTGSPRDARHLLSLGSVAYSPLWVFYTGSETFDDFSQLRGKKIAIGPVGSGLRSLSRELLKAAGAADLPTVVVDLAGEPAYEALMDGRINVMMTVGSTDSALIRELLNSPRVKLMSLSQAEAYTRLMPGLYHVTLPRGIVNIAKRLPASDIHLIAPTTNLIVRDTMHPALLYLLLDAASEIHGASGWVNKSGEFPAPMPQDFPLSDQAERFYKTGPPVLLDYLPFWVAILLDRMIKILLPVLAVMFPLMRVLPWFYSWRNRSRIRRLYGELKFFEIEIAQHPNNLADYTARVDRMENTARKITVPANFYGELYTLREHIKLVRRELLGTDERKVPPDDGTV